VLLAGSDRPFGANQFYGPYESFEHTKGWLAMLQQQLGQRMQAGLSYRRHSDVFILEVNDPAFYENNHIDEAWQGVLRRTDLLGKGIQLSTGLDGSADTIRSSSLGRHGRNQGAGYASLDLRRWQRLTLSVAGREEVFSGGSNDFSPTFAAGYRLHHNLRLRASAGHAFRLPTYTDLYYSDPTSVGNPNLKPETSWSYEAGLDWTPSGRASLELTGFQNRIGNSIDYVKTSPDARYQASNTGAVAFTGAETALHLRLPGTQQIELAYTGIHLCLCLQLRSAERALFLVGCDTESDHGANTGCRGSARGSYGLSDMGHGDRAQHWPRAAVSPAGKPQQYRIRGDSRRADARPQHHGRHRVRLVARPLAK
jgi:iron complex outermembrane receptor protein